MTFSPAGDYYYHDTFGLILKAKVFKYVGAFIGVVLAILILSLESCLPPPQAPASITISQPNPIMLSKQDKIVNYMQSVNSLLDRPVAYKLANTIIRNQDKYNLPIKLQLALITVESRFDQYAISSAGAQGFWQVMPHIHVDKIYAMFKTKEITTKNLYDPHTNTELGGKILFDCFRQYKGNEKHALLCYNGSAKDQTAKYSKKVYSIMKDITI